MGMFGISEVLLNVEQQTMRVVYETRIKGLFPSKKDWRDSARPIARGSLLGFLLGILPGGGPIISSFIAYAIEKRCSKHPEKFGTGVIEGVASPETANNSATAGSFVPLLTLGIPSNVIMALLLGAFIIHGITPGPLLIERHPQLFWGVIASMYVGNIMLLVLNLPLIGLWVKVLRIPYQVLFPLILLFCLIGVYSLNSSAVDIYVMIGAGIFGYLMRKFHYEGAPLVLAFVLGPLLETSLRQSLLMSQGSFLIFLTRPISAISLAIIAILLLSPLLPGIKKRRKVLVENVEK
jgi:putative tricarboxylic transport membrane protein